MDAKRQFSTIGWALAVYYLVCVGAQILFSIFLEKFEHLLPEFVWSDDFMMIASQIIMYGIGFPVFYCLVRNLPSWFLSEKKRISPGHLFVVFVICMGAAYIGNLIGNVLMLISDLMFGTQSMNPVTDAVLNMSPVGMFLTTVVAAPIMEEWMFRKILIDRLVPFGQKAAVVASGLSFGLFHGNFYQFFYAFSLGMIFAYLYSYTGKLRYNVLLHMGINLIGGVLPLLWEKWAGMSVILYWLGMIFMGTLVIIAIVAAIVLAAIFAGRLRWFPAWERPEKGICYSVFTASGVWAFFLVCVMEFARMF
ncbi:MAG: lysostaphin resistance A-like protein [Brotaphodocola sp.]